MEIKNLEGIELDVQMTRDGELVVIHDERVDRTTEGIGFVKDCTLSELKRLHIYAGDHPGQQVPAMEEVLNLLGPKLREGMRLNIELKNSVHPYPGMEEKLVDLVHEKAGEACGNIVYSSFLARSLERLKRLDPEAELGILDSKASDCMYKLRGGCGAKALHPFWRGVDLTAEELKGYTVRAWMAGHLYPERPTGTRLDLALLEAQGITDIILNEPEMYL